MISKDFNPNISHPAYLTRKNLHKAIQSEAINLEGILLDFGCGSKPYKSLFNVQKYIGLDFENPGHPHLNENIDNFYNGEHIPFGDNYFDCIFTSEVFEHVFNLPIILGELNRVLKKNGLILITCPFAICEHEIPNDFARYSHYGLVHLLQSNGFEIINFQKTGNSIETIFQLWITYLNLHIYNKFHKIPILRSLIKIGGNSFFNFLAILFSSLLPNTDDLYLNNVVLARKNI
ncbi:MAG: class I SAM-dependent methyltransferase [Flavobacterium sp.]|nr:class I SAM-dependent methyltransferase [Flavobacterium sp.]